MNTRVSQRQARPLARLIQSRFVAGFSAVLLLQLSGEFSHGGSATWNLNPSSGDWNTATNWTPRTVPNGTSDTATFAVSNNTGVSLSASSEVNGIVFNANASAYTISTLFPLTVSGTGITNSSGITQNFVAYYDPFTGQQGSISFTNSATAGIVTAFSANIGGLQFFNNSTADHATFNNTDNGSTVFYDSSTADHGTFANNGTQDLVSGFGYTYFLSASTAANATITNNGATIAGAPGGGTYFFDNATAENATLIANAGSGGGLGGVIYFYADSTGDTSRVELFGNGKLDLSSHNTFPTTDMPVGSLEGSGNVFLGPINLIIGSNNLNSTFSGIIQDGGSFGGTGGSLTKIGNGKLMLSGANTYTGGTTISAGTLFVTNRRGSGTGSGSIQVNAGMLGGTGRTTGSVLIGTGSGPGAFLTPGIAAARPATLTIRNNLTFKADGTFHFGYKSSNATADTIVARGVTIGSGAQLFFGPIDAGALTLGTVFTAIDNTATTPISGAFANLADGATITIGSNTFQADYEGGDGNDLTLTVVP